MIHANNLQVNPLITILMVMISLFTVSCRELPALEWTPESVKDTDYITIIGNTKSGNKGLLDFDGDVYMHLGLITSKSNHTNEWRYVKFKWGSREIAAKATPAGKNK